MWRVLGTVPHEALDLGAMSERSIRVHLDEQRLELIQDERILASYPVSTSAKGGGEMEGSEQTPRGRHEIRAKIGAAAPKGAVFVGRRPTGEIFEREMAEAEPERDWILSRILWLRGLEPGSNRLGDVDTMRRYIYIHGTPEEASIGNPASHGCLRMRNDAVIELFDLVEPGMLVEILD